MRKNWLENLLRTHILRFSLKDWYCDCDSLLERAIHPAWQIRELAIWCCVFSKAITLPTIEYTLKSYFSLEHLTGLRRKNVLVLPKPNTTTYGLNSARYAAASYWISLPDSFRRTVTSLSAFRRRLLFSHSFINTITTSLCFHVFCVMLYCVIHRRYYIAFGFSKILR